MTNGQTKGPPTMWLQQQRYWNCLSLRHMGLAKISIIEFLEPQLARVPGVCGLEEHEQAALASTFNCFQGSSIQKNHKVCHNDGRCSDSASFLARSGDTTLVKRGRIFDISTQITSQFGTCKLTNREKISMAASRCHLRDTLTNEFSMGHLNRPCPMGRTEYAIENRQTSATRHIGWLI